MSRRIAFGFMKGSVTQKLKSMAVPIANRRHYCSSSSPATHKSNLPPSSRMGRLLTGAVIGLVGGSYVSTLDEPTFSGWLFSASKLANPLFALLDPEVAHRLAISAAARGLVPKEKRPDQQILGLEVWGRRFSNPIGLSAGFDKNAEAVDGLLGLGFGFVEIGSVTPLPQEGNPKPRMFRLRDQGAIINRCGFNGDGIAAVAKRLEAQHEAKHGGKAGPGILGVNIGKNKTSEDAAADYVQGVHSLSQYADYLVALDLSLDGLIISNTTISRPEVVAINLVSKESGGLSGKPLFSLSNDILKDVYVLTKGKIPLVGCGGVSSGEDAYKKIRAGATLVQLYSAFAYGGPALIPQIKAELADCLKRDGFKSIYEAVGADCRGSDV
ncbi:putative dihydroorotate dehydrogenase (quinone) [Helianthus anomalus]